MHSIREKHKVYGIVFGLLVCSLFATSLLAQAPPAADTFISSATPKVNYGAGISHISTPPATTTGTDQKTRYTNTSTAKKLGISPGGDIMLHGLPKEYAWVGKAHTLHDWTDGCVAVTNEEMNELWKLIPVGTPIEIRP